MWLMMNSHGGGNLQHKNDGESVTPMQQVRTPCVVGGLQRTTFDTLIENVTDKFKITWKVMHSLAQMRKSNVLKLVC